MKLFLDSANLDEIREFSQTGLLDGVTTNPTLIAKSGRNIKEVISEICQLVSGPVSAEVTATAEADMLREAEVLRKISHNVAIKVPLTVDGLKVCKALSAEGTMVNVTLCFSANQALLAAKAGATFISPFIGRLDDISQEGMQLIADILQIYTSYPHFQTQVLAASVRGPQHVLDVARLGCDVATIPGSVFRQLYQHPLTEKGLDAFLSDWKKTGQSIL